MSLKLVQFADLCSENSLKSEKHILFVLSEKAENSLPFASEIENKLSRSQVEFKDLKSSPITVELVSGALLSVVILGEQLSMFGKHNLLRKAVKPLLEEEPEKVTICVFGDDATREAHACAAYYVLSVNAAELPSRKGAKSKQEKKHRPLQEIAMYGHEAAHDYAYVNARVSANTLCRSLTMLPPNELTPTSYRAKVKELAMGKGWQLEEFDMPALKKMGAGAFYAVGQGSEPMDAAIVHLTYNPDPSHLTGATKHIALVGKGICFDTGGHNLKPAKYMQYMHEDMNGSAVALSILHAVTELKWPVKIDCWLAIAQNHIGPLAYKQNDVVTALNGLTIEIVHTDAEGRMVLADTLTLASRQKPDFILDFATLTGDMAVAVTDRMSGVICNRPELACKAVGAGIAAGERIVAFPYEEDMDCDLESDIADILQCTLDAEGDHLLAARFMGKFIENDVAWVHTDLSSTNRKDGLGAVESTVNGFGVGFGLELVKALIA
ncbi:MAG: leucyl aminopeptidase family protein [Bdellovibrio sp.]|nr:leucyl aminopeptidase family protein [Methylotenera sp.]